MSQTIASLIGNDPQVLGHLQWSEPSYATVAAGGFEPAPVFDGGPDHRGDDMSLIQRQDYSHNPPHLTAHLTVADYIDRPVEGNTGPSLDSPSTVVYRADRPGFGGFNDQPWHSGPTNFSPGVVPSEEVGTGKPPGWVAAHMPVVQGVNPTRSSYAYQGVMADGGHYFTGGGAEVARERITTMRQPWWPATLDQPGQNPAARSLSMFPGSGVIESPPSMSLGQILGRFTGGAAAAGGWGVQ